MSNHTDKVVTRWHATLSLCRSTQCALPFTVQALFPLWLMCIVCFPVFLSLMPIQAHGGILITLSVFWENTLTFILWCKVPSGHSQTKLELLSDHWLWAWIDCKEILPCRAGMGIWPLDHTSRDPEIASFRYTGSIQRKKKHVIWMLEIRAIISVGYSFIPKRCLKNMAAFLSQMTHFVSQSFNLWSHAMLIASVWDFVNWLCYCCRQCHEAAVMH